MQWWNGHMLHSILLRTSYWMSTLLSPRECVMPLQVPANQNSRHLVIDLTTVENLHQQCAASVTPYFCYFWRPQFKSHIISDTAVDFSALTLDVGWQERHPACKSTVTMVFLAYHDSCQVRSTDIVTRGMSSWSWKAGIQCNYHSIPDRPILTAWWQHAVPNQEHCHPSVLWNRLSTGRAPSL